MTVPPGRTSVRLVGAAVIILLAAACGSTKTTGSSGPAKPGPAKSGPAASAAVLGVGTNALGKALVYKNGHTLYLLTADKPSHSSCSAKCLQFWPLAAAPASGAVPSVAGVRAKIATTKATSGKSMLTVGGWPLYTFVKDQKVGDINGQGVKTFGGTWYAVSPAGQPIKAAPKSVPTGSSGGYGY